MRQVLLKGRDFSPPLNNGTFFETVLAAKIGSFIALHF